MRATAEPVEGNKIRLSVEVDEPDVDRVLADMMRDLTRQARIPGFRPGKVPRQVLEARMGGAGTLRAEALREALPDFYAQAIVDADVDVRSRHRAAHRGDVPDCNGDAGPLQGPIAIDGGDDLHAAGVPE